MIDWKQWEYDGGGVKREEWMEGLWVIEDIACYTKKAFGDMDIG